MVFDKNTTVDGSGSGLLTINPAIDSNKKITKGGSFTLKLTQNNSSWNGGLKLDSGIVEITASGALGSSDNDINLSGGTLLMGGGSTINNSVGKLSLSDDSFIDFGGANATLTFDDAQSWTSGKILYIEGWDGDLTGIGGADILTIHSLPASYTNRIKFINPIGYAPGEYGSVYLGSDRIVPLIIPETSTKITVVGIMLVVLISRTRNLAAK